MTDIIRFVPDESKAEYEYAVSACLCGKHCRYDGKTKCVPEIKKLYDEGKALLICPEVMGGMPTPRAPSEIVGQRVMSINGEDNTAYFRKGAEEALKLCLKYGVKKAILKQNSPSCGSRQVYDGTFSGTLTDGMGVAAKLLSDHGIEVLGEK
ncbi:MAG: DUF523 domain-containing protein [Acutalibacteraceae bacterium]|nr:DUF523 domain-containing protein [Oscillospiraceae bacterium]